MKKRFTRRFSSEKKLISFWNLANLVSLIRIVLLPFFVWFLISQNYYLMLLAIIICPIIFLLDYLDGWLARIFKIETNIGSFLDIVGDRISEVVFWVFFVWQGLILFWIPMIVLSRSMVTDLIRAKAQEKGKSVYGMMSSYYGKILVSSRVFRGLIGASKLFLFSFATILFVFPSQELFELVLFFSFLVLVVNLMRGIPVIIEGIKFF